MRGLAATVVVLYHYGLIEHVLTPRFGYLAVDLFFVLSGFVIAHAYDQRFASGMRVRDFMVARAHRLLPLYLTGTVIGLVGVSLGYGYAIRLGPALRAASLNLLGLPYPPTMSSGSLFPINPASWSLFFEFWVANLMFAVTWRLVGPLNLVVTLGCAGMGLVWSEHRFSTMDVGSDWSTIGAGLFRVTYSFFAGVALSRLQSLHPPRRTLPPWLCLSLTLMVLWLPLRGRVAHAFELAAVIILIPMLIRYGARTAEPRPGLGELLGNISYGTYSVHMPILIIWSGCFRGFWLYHGSLMGVALTLIIAALACALNDYLDEPVRDWLIRSTRRPSDARPTTVRRRAC